MRVDEVADLNVVAHARPVAGRIVLAENLYLLMQPERGLDAALDEMGGVRRRLTEPPLGSAPATLKYRSATYRKS